jgi:hypothetical protein
MSTTGCCFGVAAVAGVPPLAAVVDEAGVKAASEALLTCRLRSGVGESPPKADALGSTGDVSFFVPWGDGADDGGRDDDDDDALNRTVVRRNRWPMRNDEVHRRSRIQTHDQAWSTKRSPTRASSPAPSTRLK